MKTKRQLINLMLSRVKDEFDNNRAAYARHLGYESGNAINNIVNGHSNPSGRVLRDLGFKAVKETITRYEKVDH